MAYTYTGQSSNSLTVGNILVNSSGTSYGTSSIYTIGTSTGTYSPSSISATVKIDQTGIKMEEGTDLLIEGKSIKKMLEAIESRLALLEPNKTLEKEWEDLKRLGDEYRALEADIKEKMKTWEILKK